MTRILSSLPGMAAVAALIAAAPAVHSAPTSASPSRDPSRTIGLVLTTETPGHWETEDGREECPDGLQATDKDNWLALNKATREQRQENFGHRWNRGPNGENVAALPFAVDDPLPVKEVKGKIAYGFNLDGTEDGRDTEKTCRHEKFRSEDGTTAIDNQLYRVMGCAKGWRTGGAASTYRLMEFPTYSANRILIEISGVDDERNDSEVEVTIYKGLDTLLKDGRGEFLPNLSQRIDARWPVIATTVGRIEDGVLTTEPIEYARFPMRWNVRTGTRDWYDLHIKLTLSPSGAEGMLGGYQDIEKYWLMYRRGLAVSTDNSAWSLPGLYQATVRLADGRRDPVSGQCTAISSLLNVKAVRTFIVHPAQSEQAGLYDLRGY